MRFLFVAFLLLPGGKQRSCYPRLHQRFTLEQLNLLDLYYTRFSSQTECSND